MAQTQLIEASDLGQNLQAAQTSAVGTLGLNSRSNLGVYLLNSNVQYEGPAPATRIERTALVAIGTYAASARLNLDAALPYWAQYDTTIFTTSSRPRLGSLWLRARYAILPEANGFALLARGGLETSDSASNNPSVFAELQPLWRVGNGSVASVTLGLAQAQQTLGRQYLAGSWAFAATPALVISPSLRFTRYADANGFSAYTSTGFGLSTVYALSNNWQLVGALGSTRYSAPTFFGFAGPQAAQQVDLSVGVVRVF